MVKIKPKLFYRPIHFGLFRGMDVPNGLMCRYCGKKWFPHSLFSHEKNCRRKICVHIDLLFQSYRGTFIYPPEFVEWPVPPKIDIYSYNNHAFAEYQAQQQPCPKCGRVFPLIGIPGHISECGADPKEKAKAPPKPPGQANAYPLQNPGSGQNKKQLVMQSIGFPKPQPKEAPIQQQRYAQDDGDEYESPQPRRSGGGGGGFGGGSGGPGGSGGYKIPAGATGPEGPDNRVACSKCGRKFDPTRIDAHERICNKVKFHVTTKEEEEYNKAHKKDEVEKMIERNQKGFDGSRWAEMGGGSGGGGAAAYGGGKSAGGARGSGGARGGPKSAAAPRRAPPDPYGDRLLPDGRVMCQKCGRGFAKDRIDKHEAVCTNLVNMQTSQVRAKPLTGRPAQYGQAGAPGFKKSPGAASSAAAPRDTPKTSGAARPAAGGGGGGAKFCSECGAAFGSSTAKFCGECGAKRV